MKSKKKPKKPKKLRKLNILVLNYEFPPLGGGGSYVSYEIAKRYAKLGHKVDVVTMHYKGLKYFERKDGINIYRVKCIRTRKEICHPWEQLTYIISAKKFLKQHLKKHNYDINHTHFIIPTGVISLWLKKHYNIPYIITAHGSDVPNYNPDRFKLMHKFTPLLLRKIVREAKIISSPSRYLLKLIEKNIIPLGKKGVVIPNGIDINKFKPKKKKKIIFSTGRLLPRKGFQYLIQAVSDRGYGYEVHIAGDGPMMQQLKKLAESSKTRIIFHGWLNNNSKKFKDLLGSASIFVLLSQQENASLSLLEAMSAGCAIITSSAPGCREMTGKSGIIVSNQDNISNLRKTISALTTNPRLIKKYGKLARQRALKEFDWSKIIKRYMEVLLKKQINALSDSSK